MKTFLQGVAAIRSMMAAGHNIGRNNCKLRTREAFGVASNGTPTAAASWFAAYDKHVGPDPAAAPGYTFGWATGGGGGAGHVWVNLGGGRILTPGGPSDDDHWTETTTAALFAGWPNLHYAGWTYSIDGKTPGRPVAPKIPKTAPAKLAAFLHLDNYAANDSLRGVHKAAKRKGIRRAIDLNWHVTADLVWVNTHWRTPLEHGFAWDKTATPAMRKLAKSTPIDEMTWDQVRHLVSKGRARYRINRAETVLALCDKLGVRVEFEDKGGGGRRREAYRRLFAIPAVQRLLKRGLFLVKTLVLIPGAAARLRAVKTVEPTCPTLISATNAKNKHLSIAKYGAVADYGRGGPIWVA